MKTSLRSSRVVVCSLALCALFQHHVFAQAPKVLLIAAEPVGPEDVRARLEATGRFAKVDLLQVQDPGTTPSLSTLLDYDAVLTWTDAPYAESDALGDVLSQYVDAGHGVVQAALAFFADDPAFSLGGRWRALGYDAFTLGGVGGLDGLTLVAVPGQELHPILDGIFAFNGGTGIGHTGLTVVNGQLIAQWSNGMPLVSGRSGLQTGRIVGLNVYPGFVTDSQGTQLFANALVFAATQPAPVNHPPSANAGPDQTLEAVGPSGAPFILTGSGSDPDGDALTLSWSGPLWGSGSILSGTLAPPVAVKAVSYTFKLTVDDHHGGVATDNVVVTVTDTTAPVLANVPASIVTALATSAAGTQVPYGPITAIDAVDGARPVSCSKSGLFPIGDTLVTCTSSDSRGNSRSVSFTVRVTDVTTPGFMRGDGCVRVGAVHYEIEFAVRQRAAWEGAVLELRVKDERYPRRKADRFTSRKTDFVAFSNNPAIHPGSSRVNTVVFSGTGEWNGHAGYRYEMTAADTAQRGHPREMKEADTDERGHPRTAVRLTITSPTGVIVAHVEGIIGSECPEVASLSELRR
jgi:hypothetical protein